MHLKILSYSSRVLPFAVRLAAQVCALFHTAFIGIKTHVFVAGSIQLNTDSNYWPVCVRANHWSHSHSLSDYETTEVASWLFKLSAVFSASVASTHSFASLAFSLANSSVIICERAISRQEIEISLGRKLLHYYTCQVYNRPSARDSEKERESTLMRCPQWCSHILVRYNNRGRE